jgi:hypothetical protein
MLLETKIFLIDSTVQLQIHIVCNRVLYCTVHCGEKGDKREGKQRGRWSGIIRILPPTNWIPDLMIFTLRTYRYCSVCICTMERLGQSQLNHKLEVPRLTCPGRESNPGFHATTLEKSHSNSLFNCYSEPLQHILYPKFRELPNQHAGTSVFTRNSKSKERQVSTRIL